MKHLSTIPESATIAVLGSEGSFSYKGGGLIRDKREDLSLESYNSMRAVRKSTENEQFALLPRINYSSGPEQDNATALIRKSWRIRGQVLLQVQMCIGGHSIADWDSVTDVHSKDVGIRQCIDALDQHCPDAQWHEENSTLASANIVAEMEDPSHIAIASRSALEAAGLNIWLENASNAEMMDQKNITDFMLVSAEQPDEALLDPDMKYHGLVLTPENRSGVMKDIDSILFDYGMDKESQPEHPYGMGLYRFLILFKKIDEHSDISGMLQELEKLIPANGTYPLIKSLGSWNDRIIDPSLKNTDD